MRLGVLCVVLFGVRCAVRTGVKRVCACDLPRCDSVFCVWFCSVCGVGLRSGVKRVCVCDLPRCGTCGVL